MTVLPLVLLAALAAWAASVVRHDQATSKITNRNIFLGAKLFAAAAACRFAAAYSGLDGGAGLFAGPEFYLLLAKHVIWSTLAGVLLWYAEIWPAGDAKFFILVSSFLPVIRPDLKTFPDYLSLNLLVNIFVLASFFAVAGFVRFVFSRSSVNELLAGAARDARVRFSPGALRENAAQNLVSLANLLLIFLAQQVMMMVTREGLGRFLFSVDALYFFFFILWDKVRGLFRSRVWLYVTPCVYLGYFIAAFFFFRGHIGAMLSTAALNVLKFSLLLAFGRFVLLYCMGKKDLVYVGAEELAAGMVLSPKELEKLKANPVFEGAFEDSFKDGLAAEQVGLLKDWLKKLPVGNASVETVRGYPFALWIAAGAAVSLFFDRNIVSLLR